MNEPSGHRKRALKRRLWEMQDGRCAHCAEVLLHPNLCAGLENLEPYAPTLDHAIPKSQGGLWLIEHLLLAHRDCNEARGDGPLPSAAIAVWNRNLDLLEAHRRAA